MSDKAVEVIAEALKEQGAAYPNAGSRLVVDALKAAGIALVELPQPGTELFDGWKVLYDGAPEEMYVEQGKVCISGGDSFSPDNARQLGAALLAAADAAEARDE